MGLSERQPRTNIIRKVAKIGVPVALLVSQAACGTNDINFPPCDTDPQPKNKKVTFNYDRPDRGEVKIEKITIKATPTVRGIDIDQHEQPEGHRIEALPDEHKMFRGPMEFRGTNGRTYSISMRPGAQRALFVLTVKADCETPKTNP